MIRFVFFFFCSFSLLAQNELPFKQGEFLKYKVTYGIIHAGYATLKVEKATIKNQEFLHAIGDGWTVGITDFFFPVKDRYESFFYPETLRPKRFIRKISEGSHTKDKEIIFDSDSLKATVFNHKKNKQGVFSIHADVKDMLLSVYFFRSLDLSKYKTGEVITINLFYDEETYPLKLIVQERETVNTDFGKLKAVKIMPIVEEGRVFKANESLEMWFTDDQNKIPIKLRASILVGHIRMELQEFKGLSHPIQGIFN